VTGGEPSAAARTGRYVAFISYSHKDRAWAQWLHRAIETYHVPEHLEGAATERLQPVFLDRAELPSSSDLAASVRDALERSDFLIVVGSPDAARSRWVNEEVRTFKALGRAAQILCLTVAGDPGAASGAMSASCFPPALRFVVENGEVTARPASEPLAADVRPGKDDRRTARLKIVAGLLGVPLDRLVQREQARRQRRLAFVAAAAVAGCIVLAGLSLAAVLARNEADRQRRLAEQNSLTATRTADFLKSLFSTADPSEARGRSITALEVLDRGALQIDAQLKAEPEVRADLMTTLGEVYTSLGLLTQGADLIAHAQAIPGLPSTLAARQATALAEVAYQRGDYPAATAALDRARGLIDAERAAAPAARTRMLDAAGDVSLATDDYAAARRSFEAALAASAAPAIVSPELVARAAEGIAQCDLFEKHYAAAEQEFQRALAAQLAATGELHPRTSEILNQLGSLAYLTGDNASAERYFRRTAAIEARVLGDQHTDLAITRNNLARVLLEQRKITEARGLLEQSVAARAGKVVETDAQMAFVFSNLALADAALGDYKTAEPLYYKGLAAAIANKHRLHGPILADLADLECHTGRYLAALARLDEARPIVAARYPDDAWRAAYVDNVRGGCLVGLHRYEEARRLLADSTPIVMKKFPAPTLFGHDAIERNIRLYTATGDDARLAQYRAMLSAH